MIVDRIIHILVLFIFPPLLFSFINKTKAFFAGRKGPPLLQPYYDLFKLFRKGLVISNTTTWVFIAGPIVSFVAVAIASLILPLGFSSSIVSFTGDFILFAYLFGLVRFFTTAAAMDTGSAFEGMGAAREVTFAVFTEAGLFFAYLVFVKISGSLTMDKMLHASGNLILNQGNIAPLVMIILGLAIIILAENCRIPVDDPNTHLELTMIHEVMVLDHSGPLFGLIEYTASIKLFIFISILINIITPIYSQFLSLNWVIYIVEVIVASIIIGIVESVIARLKMTLVPLFLVASILLCGSAFILFVR